ncbi:hypothetical protein LOZ65_000487 [Ophidiomyces ophidiicola]|nr:hypothetical protein LOZ65_000487 [Ophidiomyces ophidiicola]
MHGVRKDGVLDNSVRNLDQHTVHLTPGPFNVRQSQETKAGSGLSAGKKESGPVGAADTMQLADEKRLLGNYRADPNAVKINTPGTSTITKPKSISALKSLSTFKPTNTLGPRTKKPATISPFFVSKPGIEISVSESGGSPRKKRKTENAAVINLDDEETIIPNSASSTDPTSIINKSLLRNSPNSRVKSRGLPSLSEYWETKDTQCSPCSTEDKKASSSCSSNQLECFDPEAFMKSAKQERVDRAAAQSSNQNCEKMDSVISAVEIPVYRSSGNRTRDTRNQKACDGHRLIRQDSPDELQGDRTLSDFWKTRAVSPSDIQPTQFSSTSQTQTRLKNRDTEDVKFHLTIFRSGVSAINEPSQLVVDKSGFTLRVKATKHRLSSNTYDIKKVIKILHDDRSSLSKIRLKFSKSSTSSDTADMIFANGEDRETFCGLLQRLVPGVKKNLKESSWMDRAFASERSARPSSHLKRPSPKEIVNDYTLLPGPSKIKRSKLSDQLLNESAGSSKEVTIPIRAQRAFNSASPGRLAESFPNLCHAHSQASEPHGGISIPVKIYQKNTPNTHMTRSSARQKRVSIESDEEVLSEIPIDLKTEKRWTKPLIYPKTGKKRAEVEAHDLTRLRDGEFLNDNLISFYIRFLEHHLERKRLEVLQRTYFFNTFFYASLKNTPRGKKGINYQGVEKWTRAIDIFSCDYVVIPINENAHWYMAIVCNLPTLFEANYNSIRVKDRGTIIEGQSENESFEGLEHGYDTGRLAKGKDEHFTHSFSSLVSSGKLVECSSPVGHGDISKQSIDAGKDGWPEEDENQIAVQCSLQHKTSAPSTPRRQPKLEDSQEKGSTLRLKKKRHKSRPSLPKLEPKQPVIITFDSLGCSRSPTIKILREYLEEEAKSKRGITIDSKTIKGMTAQQIPLQPNYSDCGLYLLAYLENFVQDPDTFVTKLLQREMHAAADWPNLKSGVLRRRLHAFLNKLYDEEEEEQQNGSMLVDTEPLNILLVDAEVESPKEQQMHIESQPEPSALGTELHCQSKDSSEKSPLENNLNPRASSDCGTSDGAPGCCSRLPTPIPGTPPMPDKVSPPHPTSPAVLAPGKRVYSTDPFIDELEELVYESQAPRELRKLDIVEVPETPPPVERTLQADQINDGYIPRSPIL